MIEFTPEQRRSIAIKKELLALDKQIREERALRAMCKACEDEDWVGEALRGQQELDAARKAQELRWRNRLAAAELDVDINF